MKKEEKGLRKNGTSKIKHEASQNSSSGIRGEKREDNDSSDSGGAIAARPESTEKGSQLERADRKIRKGRVPGQGGSTGIVGKITKQLVSDCHSEKLANAKRIEELQAANLALDEKIAYYEDLLKRIPEEIDEE
jgi:hypothetical protein